jgi:hypothetical protein
LVFALLDHFLFANTAQWTTTATDLGSAAVGDARRGIMTLTASDGTVADNDEIYYFSSKEVFLIAAGEPIGLKTSIQFAEANTNAANIFVGFMNAPAADSLVDNGGGPRANFSGAGFYKIDGELNWRVIYSDGTTRTVEVLDATHKLLKGQARVAGGASYQTLEIVITPKTATLCDVIFDIDGVVVSKMTDRTFANATEMTMVYGVKNGSAHNQTLNIDYVNAVQTV